MSNIETRPLQESERNATFRYPGLNKLRIDCDGQDELPTEEYFQFIDDLTDLRVASKGIQYTSDVGLARAALLGGVVGALFTLHFVGLVYSIASSSLLLFMWCFYFSAIMFYHAAEFLLQALYNPSQTTCDQFLFNHSKPYQIAFAVAWAEYWVEALVFPGLKASLPPVVVAGMMLMIVGQGFRSAAMIQAGYNFTHLIQFKKRAAHRLVTTGVYSYFRHPSYFGWFWFVIGSQLVLCNPVCFVAYVVVSWRFFENRIRQEETTLLAFFPDEYPQYKKDVSTGIPFL